MKIGVSYRAWRMKLSVLAAIWLFYGSVEMSVAGSARDLAKIRKVTFDYAACVVRKHHDKAAEAILSTASNSVIMSQMSQILDSDCLGHAAGFGVDMRFPDDTYRYALADALVGADFAEQGPSSFANRLPLAQPLLITSEEKAAQLAQVRSEKKRKALNEKILTQNSLGWLLRYGECVVRADAENSRLWLLTPPDIPEELSRIQALQPAFAACLGDRTVKFTRIRMRGAVALNYYRLAKATVVPVAK